MKIKKVRKVASGMCKCKHSCWFCLIPTGQREWKLKKLEKLPQVCVNVNTLADSALFPRNKDGLIMVYSLRPSLV